MLTFPTPSDRRLRDLPPLCIGCGYLLLHLTEPRCPECGRQFDPNNERTFRRIPGLLLWKYWLPGFALATSMGIVLAVAFSLMGNPGWGLVIGTPLGMGFLLGYGIRLGLRWKIIFGIAVIIPVILTLITLNIAGTFCGVILSILFLMPTSVGVLFGSILRAVLKDSKFSQRWYLPIAAALLIPMVAHGVQLITTSPPPPEEISTEMLMPVPLHAAWKSQIFKGTAAPPSNLAMHVGLTRPTETTGSSLPGDVKLARFTKGNLQVRITQREEDKLLAFDFIGQTRVEDRAIRLIGSRFDFQAIAPSQTRVTLTTKYQPLMTPRWYWRPFEAWAGETMHHYILQAQAEDAGHRAASTQLAQ